MVGPRLVLLALLHLLLACASCAGDPVPRAPGAESQAWFPLQRGARWSYDLRTGFFSASTHMEVSARGEFAVRDSADTMFLMEEQLSGRIYGLEARGLVGYQISEGYLTRIAAVELGADRKVHVFGGEGVSFLPVDPKPGQHWSDRTEVFRESGSAGQTWTAEVEAAGPICVPAGTFDDVIVVRSQHWDPQWDSSEPLHSYEDYYARGIGLIKSSSHNNAQWFFMSVEQVLVAVHFDAE